MLRRQHGEEATVNVCLMLSLLWASPLGQHPLALIKEGSGFAPSLHNFWSRPQLDIADHPGRVTHGDELLERTS